MKRLLLIVVCVLSMYNTLTSQSLYVDANVGDCNCDKKINISDVVFLINYMFAGGPAPKCDGIVLESGYQYMVYDSILTDGRKTQFAIMQEYTEWDTISQGCMVLTKDDNVKLFKKIVNTIFNGEYILIDTSYEMHSYLVNPLPKDSCLINIIKNIEL